MVRVYGGEKVYGVWRYEVVERVERVFFTVGVNEWGCGGRSEWVNGYM